MKNETLSYYVPISFAVCVVRLCCSVCLRMIFSCSGISLFCLLQTAEMFDKWRQVNNTQQGRSDWEMMCFG